MRILYIITRADMGGAQKHLLKLLGVIGTDHEIAVAAGEEGEMTSRVRELGKGVFIVSDLIRAISPWRDLKASRALSALIRSWEPDLVHCHSSKAGLLGRFAAYSLGIPSIFTAHGWAFAEGVALSRKAMSVTCEWLAGLSTTHVIVASEYERQLGLRYRAVRPDRIQVIYEGIEDTALVARPGLAEVPNIIMVARFSEQKDHNLLLRALAGIRSNFRLWFIGDGPLIAHCRAQADELGLSSRVNFMGNRHDVPQLLAQAHIFVLASKYEGVPMCIIEALRAGLPIVASDVGGLRECVQNGKSGYLVSRGEVAPLQAALLNLMVDPHLRESFGQAGRNLYEEHFRISAKEIGDKTQAVYDRALLEHQDGNGPKLLKDLFSG